MNFEIHSLELHRDITLPPDAPAADGTNALFEYKSLTSERDLEPDPKNQLTDGKLATLLPKGTYLFAQGTLTGPVSATRALPDPETERLFREGAEAVWLEAIWREIELKKNRTFVRVLSEDSKTVFQVFREL
jgi:hypothetical protein